jgi:FKBP-type peptidyl-prolyl cis-trans isomerase FkpA
MLARLAVSSLAVIAGLACAGHGAPPTADREGLPRADDGVLYAIGDSLGEQVKLYAFDEVEAQEVARGLVDHALGRPYAGPLDETLAGKVALFHEQRVKELARREELAGAPALERALHEPGAVKTQSGMILNVLDPGSGPSPGMFDYVTVDYRGTLRDGTVFDTSEGKESWRSRLGETNRCWQEALGSVGAGARLRVACPPSIGFGWGGWPGVVPGGSVLVYELELLRVEAGTVPQGYSRDGSAIGRNRS